MCGLMLAFVVAAALWHRRRTGGVARIDFSMIEAMLWTMAEPLLATQLGAPPQPHGNHSEPLRPARRLPLRRRRRLDQHRRHAATRNGADLCAIVPALSPMAGYGVSANALAQRAAIDEALAAWARPHAASAAATELLRAGIPAAALASSLRPRRQRSSARARFLGSARHAAFFPACRGAPASAGPPAPRRSSAPTPRRSCEKCSACPPHEIAALRQCGRVRLGRRHATRSPRRRGRACLAEP